ncbi:hypothetical protein ACFVIB_22615 [Streptomyces nigra]|uniref:hypothetical protein n=1 Tax=Streptomyces nigra TaxID=1827580 RepID=UPI00363E7F7E
MHGARAEAGDERAGAVRGRTDRDRDLAHGRAGQRGEPVGGQHRQPPVEGRTPGAGGGEADQDPPVRGDVHRAAGSGQRLTRDHLVGGGVDDEQRGRRRGGTVRGAVVQRHPGRVGTAAVG